MVGGDMRCEVCGGWGWEQMGGVRCEVEVGDVRYEGGDGSRCEVWGGWMVMEAGVRCEVRVAKVVMGAGVKCGV